MLELIGVSCRYGNVEAVRRVSLQVQPGQVVGLFGANGAGKSTLIRGIAGHGASVTGSVRWESRELASLGATERARLGIGIVPEGRRLFGSLTVHENLIVGGYRLSRAKERRNLEHVLALFPQLQARWQTPVRLLSGGEQQMVAIGRALMGEPRLLLVDEISLGLNPINTQVCYRALETLRHSGVAVLVVEQRTEMALSFVDAVYVVKGGELSWHGKADAVDLQSALKKAYLDV